MGFFSFLGRVLFASLFILCAWQLFNEFGTDGGPGAKKLAPKLAVAKSHLSSSIGVAIPDVDLRYLIASSIALQGIGGILFVFGSSFGAYLLLLHLAIATPLLCDFYNYSSDQKMFAVLLNDFLLRVALFGALLFFVGMKNSLPRRQLKKKTPKTKTG